MNSDFSPTPREELEAQITALLLGELSENEAAALREKIASDPELRKLHTEIGMTIGLLKEAMASPEPAEIAAPEGLKLSAGKRERLLASFKVVKAPKPAREPIRIDLKTWGALAAMIVALLAVSQSALFTTTRSRTTAQNRNMTLTAEALPETENLNVVRLQDSLREEQAKISINGQLPAIRFDSDADRAAKKPAGNRVEIALPPLETAQEVDKARGAVTLGGAFYADNPELNKWTSLGVPAEKTLALGDVPQAGRLFGQAPAEPSFGGGGGARGFGQAGEAKNVGGAGGVPGMPAGPQSTTLGYGVSPAPADGAQRGQDWFFRQTPEQARNLYAFDAPAQTKAGEKVESVSGLALGKDLSDLNVADHVVVAQTEISRGRTLGRDVEAQVVLKEELGKSDALMARPNEVEALKRDSAGVAVDGLQVLADDAKKSKAVTERVEQLLSARRTDPSTGLPVSEFSESEARMVPTERAWAPSMTPPAKRPVPRQMVNVEQAPNTSLIEIKVKSDDAAEAARIANAVADVYQKTRSEGRVEASQRGIKALEQELAKADDDLARQKAQLQKLQAEIEPMQAKPVVSNPAIPQPEVASAANPFSTFSLNVSDVSFKLAAASLEKSVMPEAGSIRSEEFINAFDYRDPAAVSAPVAFAWERARYPFAHDRDLLRFSVKTAASGREAGKPLNLVLLLDASGSMERADRVRIIRECLRVLATQLQAQDRVSVVTFARTPRLWVDGLPGDAAQRELVTRVGTVTPEGGTNLEDAMRVGYETAAKHFQASGVNRLVLLTDGAANLGDVQPESLKKRVEENRKKGIALDCFGIGWEGLNDDLLEQLSRNGDGRYGFVNTPEAATTEFAQQLAGALKVAASDVKVQVEFNAKRATAYRQIGYAKHQLTKEQFRDNTVDAAEIGVAEAGNALYVVQVNPAGEGPIATVRVRFKVPGTNDYREHEWPVNYEGAATALEQSTATMRLAGAASAFSEWLAASPYAGEVTPDRLLGLMANIPEAFSNDSRPKQLEWMIRQAKSIAGKQL